LAGAARLILAVPHDGIPAARIIARNEFEDPPIAEERRCARPFPCAEATTTVGCPVVLTSLRSEHFDQSGVSKKMGPEMESVGDQRASPDDQ
jgi:hypothetical protein